MLNILFSIIIPTYNRADFIAKTIQSALNQTYTYFEIIVVDDGSTDNTQKIVEVIEDKRIHYYKKENAERGAARNFGIKKAKGNYVTFLDSDDILYPNYLTEAYRFIEKNLNPVFFFQSYDIINQKGEIISNSNRNRKNILKDLINQGNFIACQGIFISKDVAVNHLFNETYELAGSEDYELWLRLASKFNTLHNPVTTSALVEHENRSVTNINPEKLILRKELMLKFLFEDDIVAQKLSPHKNILLCNAYSYVSLHLAIANHKKDSFKYLIKSLKTSPSFILKRRFLAIVKHLLF